MENQNKEVGLFCFLKTNIYIYGMNGGNMAKKEESPYDIEQEGNHGWLWNALLNRIPGDTLLSIVE